MYIVNERTTHDSSTLKYYQDNLVPDQYTLVLSGDLTPLARPSMNLDFITALLVRQAQPCQQPCQRTCVTTFPITLYFRFNKPLSTGTVIGAVVGGAVGFLLLVALLALGFLMHRRRRRKDRLVEDSMVLISPQLQMESNPKALEAELSHNFAMLENMVFPLPPPTEAVAVTQRPAIAPSSASELSFQTWQRDVVHINNAISYVYSCTAPTNKDCTKTSSHKRKGETSDSSLLLSIIDANIQWACHLLIIS